MQDEGAKALAEALKKNRSLSKLYIGISAVFNWRVGWSRVTAKGIKAIADATRENHTFVYIQTCIVQDHACMCVDIPQSDRDAINKIKAAASSWLQIGG